MFQREILGEFGEGGRHGKNQPYRDARSMVRMPGREPVAHIDGDCSSALCSPVTPDNMKGHPPRESEGPSRLVRTARALPGASPLGCSEATIMRLRHQLFALLTLPWGQSLCADDWKPDPGFRSLFNGKDLTG